MDWFEYRNEIPLNTLKAWREKIIPSIDIKYEGWTGTAREPYRHWAAYPDYEGVYVDIFECLNESFKDDGLDLQPQRVIVNFYSHGDSSWLHVDGKKDSDWTAILFMNEYWDLNWGGDFVLVKDNELYQATAPTPGKFVLFKGNILHAARPVSREAQFPRIGLAIQCTNNTKI